LGYNGGNGCIDALLTHNFKPCWVYKVSVCLLDCIMNIICLIAGNPFDGWQSSWNLEACNPILRAVVSAHMERAMVYHFEYWG